MHSLSSVINTELGSSCKRDLNKSRRKHIKMVFCCGSFKAALCFILSRFSVVSSEFGGLHVDRETRRAEDRSGVGERLELLLSYHLVKRRQWEGVAS